MQSGEPFADEGFDDEDVAEDIPADPYGFNANIQQFMDDPGSTSMQFRDVPEAAESFRRASGSLAGDLDDSGFNAQKRGNRRPANTAAGGAPKAAVAPRSSIHYCCPSPLVLLQSKVPQQLRETWRPLRAELIAVRHCTLH